MGELLRKFRSERGLTTLEWLVIAGLVVVMAAGMFAYLVPKVRSATDNVGKTLDGGTKQSVPTMPNF